MFGVIQSLQLQKLEVQSLKGEFDRYSFSKDVSLILESLYLLPRPFFYRASSLGNSIAQASEKTLGSDFNRLASKTGEAAKNSGKTVLNAFESTSMIYAGGNAAAGTSKGMKEDAKDGESL